MTRINVLAGMLLGSLTSLLFGSGGLVYQQAPAPATFYPEPLAVRTSDPLFAPRWATLPKPPAPTLRDRWTTDLTGREAGTYEVAYCLVDELGRLTALSPAATIKPTLAGWEAAVEFPGLDKWTRAVGTAAFYRRIDPGYTGWQVQWYPLGGQTNCQNPANVVRPYLPLCGWEWHRYRRHRLHAQAGYADFTDTSWPKGSDLPLPPGPPDVQVLGVPNYDLEVCYTWRGNVGESPPSDAIQVTRRLDQFPNVSTPFELFRGTIPPQGALGMHVYARKPGLTKWHRQPAPHCTAAQPTKDEYLWPLDYNRFVVHRFLTTDVGPDPTPGKSWLCSLQVAMRDSDKDVIIDSDQTLCSPVVSAYEGWAWSWAGDTGKWYNNAGYIPHKFSRTIGTGNGGTWKLLTSPTTPDGASGYPTEWPMWVENSQKTRVVGCLLRSQTAVAGFAAFDHFGGGAFRLKLVECTVDLARPGPGYTCGIRQLWDGLSPDTHSLSEFKATGCTINAYFPAVCEGNQSQNWTFDDLEAVSTAPVGGHDSSIITLNNSGTIRVLNRLTCDGARSIVANISGKRFDLQNVWLDQGAPCYFTLGTASSPTITASFTKTNQWADWLHLVEAPNAGRNQAEVLLTVDDAQSGGPLSPSVFSPRYRAVRLQVTAPPSFWDGTCIKTPTLAKWQQTPYWASWDGSKEPITPPAAAKSYGFGADTIQP